MISKWGSQSRSRSWRRPGARPLAAADSLPVPSRPSACPASSSRSTDPDRMTCLWCPDAATAAENAVRILAVARNVRGQAGRLSLSALPRHDAVLLRCELRVIKLRIQAFGGQELLVRSALADPSVLH